jgi:DNA-binding NtrC family response regulator
MAAPQLFAGRGGTETVLLVEPQPDARTLIAFMLTRLGYCVLESRNAAEAVTLYNEYGGAIDLLFTEAEMSRVNGHDLSELLKRNDPGLRVLFLADAPYERLARRVASQKHLHFLTRPFAMAQLAAKVREALDAPLARRVSAAV